MKSANQAVIFCVIQSEQVLPLQFAVVGVRSNSTIPALGVELVKP